MGDGGGKRKRKASTARKPMSCVVCKVREPADAETQRAGGQRASARAGRESTFFRESQGKLARTALGPCQQ